MRKILFFVTLIIFLPSVLSCTHADDHLEEYSVEISRVVADSATMKDSSSNDSSSKVVIVKDTIKLSYEMFMRLTPTVNSSQGSACYGKYFLQCYSGNNFIEVFDLEEKKYVCKITNPHPGNKTHANTAFFGNQRISPDDFFPLLYICSGYTTNKNSFIHAYRIIKYENADGTDGWNAEYVYTITLKGFGSWTEGVIDQTNNILWVKDEPNGTEGEYHYTSFQMPEYEDGNVTINKENAIALFALEKQPFTSSNQGHLFHDNKILLVSGTSYTEQKLAFIVINTLTQTRELVIDLAEIGLIGEPESVFYYKDQLMIGYRGAVFKFNLYPNK